MSEKLASITVNVINEDDDEEFGQQMVVTADYMSTDHIYVRVDGQSYALANQDALRVALFILAELPRRALDKLDGSMALRVSLMTGFARDQLDELGGFDPYYPWELSRKYTKGV